MPRLPLGSLNVLVGPNGSGKSNLLDAIALLRSAPTDLRPVILRGGGVGEWIWKGAPHGDAMLEAIFDNPDGSQALRHFLVFQVEQQSFRLRDELIAVERIANKGPNDLENEPYFYYGYQQGRPVINTRTGNPRNLRGETVQPD